MEVVFEKRKIPTYKCVMRSERRIQETAESVVPDINDDIGRVASVQTDVLLKSKDVEGKNVMITGEASAVLVYITEDEHAVSFLKVSKNFSMEFPLSDSSTDLIPQIKLKISNSEARIINPRKVSVTFEICGELECYSPDEMNAEIKLPEDCPVSAHVKYETANINVIRAVCEKTFSVNDQFTFPAGKPKPDKMVFQNADFMVTDAQLVGSKAIIKGNVKIKVCYMSPDADYPVMTEFTAPFSQMIDTGRENLEKCSACIEITSAYYDLTDTISGEKAMDAELHAVAQLVCRSEHSIKYISDIYSNLFPVCCEMQTTKLDAVCDERRLLLSKEEHISVSEDCADVLSVFTSMGQSSAAEGKAEAYVVCDILYRSKSGSLAAAHRQFVLQTDGSAEQERISWAKLTDAVMLPDGSVMSGRMNVELGLQRNERFEYKSMEKTEFCEDRAYDFSHFPAVTLVRVENEDLWELAKTYHSSIERICSVNETEDGVCGRLLLVPKSV